MKIGIDLSPLQTPHRMRGIGFTLLNFINNIDEENRKQHHYTFFVMPPEHALFKDPLELLNLEHLAYDVVTIQPSKKLTLRLPWRFKLIVSIINQLIVLSGYYIGNNGFGSVRKLDIFMQFDQSQALPHVRKVKKILVVYDMIPYILEWDYLWNYRTARLNGRTIRGSTKKQVLRWAYYKKLRLNVRAADLLVAISESTKKDIVDHLNIKPQKIKVVYLGVAGHNTSDDTTPALSQYTNTSWGYVKKPLESKTLKDFLLFVGGVDHRRKLPDIVTAFSQLRAKGIEVKLVLAGDIMLGPNAITIAETRDSLKNCSYLEDIIFMGFIDDSSRSWLYRNALAFVFPSRYEGFGLPVLEAFAQGCPVISYRNLATVEVADTVPLYASNPFEIAKNVEELLNMPEQKLESLRRKMIKQAEAYTWAKTTGSVFSLMLNEK